MADPKFEKVSPALHADALLSVRPNPDASLVLVASYGKAYGYWGRCWSVKGALRNSQWIARGDSVLVCLASKDSYINPVTGSIHDPAVTDVYRGTVLANGDVKITHKLVRED